jgi:hypothetical protein
MMKRFTAALALWLLLLAGPVLGAAGTPTQLGTANGTTTATITAGATAPVGSLVVVVISSATSNIAVTSVVDSALNCTTYTALDNTAVASRPTVAVFYCANIASALTSGVGTITVTVPSTDKIAATAFYVTGMTATPADVSGKQVNGASGSSATSTTTGARAQKYELIVGGLALAGTSSAFTPTTGFTSIGGLSSANGSAYAAYMFSCATTSQAWAPTWTTSNAYMSDVVSFKIAADDAICSSKTNAYQILQYGTAGQISASKTNAYIVLQAFTPATAKGFFHSFPP